MTPGFDFSAFEKEAAGLLASMRATADRMGAYEDEAAGRMRGGDLADEGGDVGAEGEFKTEPSDVTDSEAMTAEIRDRGMATDELTARQAELEDATAGSADSQRVMAQSLADSNAQMSSAGALNNEFIESAKQGEVTIGELGAQIVGTTAKFGGWIIAGGAVYFIAKALAAMKLGAIEASSGVDMLSRVLDDVKPNQAMDQFQSLAGKFNVPISTVTNAAFEVGKVYHNETSDFKATEAVLYAVKLGEIETAEATQYLTSIVKEFNLPASQMGDVLDQVNQAQREFGVSTEDSLQALSKAGAVVRLLSGDYKDNGQALSYLIALNTTAMRVTGEGGSRTGQAIARGALGSQKPKTEELLRTYGIDPSGSIEDTINQAMAISQELDGKQLESLATGLGGGVRGAKTWAALFQNPDLFKEVQEKTSPAASKGSAQTELEKQLGGVDEKIKQLGVSMERIGEGLASSHLLASLGAMLEILNQALLITNDFVQAFSQLPPFAQQFLAYLIQASLAVKIFRSLNVGQSIAGGAGAQPEGMRGSAARFFGYESPGAYAKQVRSGLGSQEEFFLGEKQRLGKQASTASTTEYYGGVAAQEANERLINAKASGASSEELVAATQQQVATERAYLAQKQDVVAIQSKINANNDQLMAVQAQNAEASKGTDEAIGVAQREGIPVPAGIGASRGAMAPIRLAAPILPAHQEELDAIKEMESRGIIPAEESTESLTEEASDSTGKLSTLGTKVSTLSGKFGGFSGALGGLMGSFMMIGMTAMAIGMAVSMLEGIVSEVEGKMESIHAPSMSVKERSERLQNYRHPEGETLGERFTGFSESIPLVGSGKDPYHERVDAELEAAMKIQTEEKAQANASQHGEAIPFMYIDQIKKEIEQVQHSGKTHKEIDTQLKVYEEEIQKSNEALNPSKGGAAKIAQAEEKINETKANVAKAGNMLESLLVLPSEIVEKHLSSALDQAGGKLGEPYNEGDAQKAAKAYEALTIQMQKEPGAETYEKLQDAKEKYYEGIQQDVSGGLTSKLLMAKTQPGREAAFAQAAQEYKKFGESSSADLDRLKKEQETHEKELGVAENKTGPPSPTESAAIKKLKTLIDSDRERYKQLNKAEEEKQKYMQEMIQTLKIQEYEAESALHSAELAASQAITNNPIQQTTEEIQELGEQINEAIKIYGEESQQVMTLVAQQRKARQTLAADHLSLIQAQGTKEIAGITQSVPKERATLTGAHGLEAQLADMKAHPNEFDPKEIIDMEASVIAARAQLAKAAEEEATQLKDDAFKIQAARATQEGDPSKAAEIAVKEAQYNLAHALTPVEKANAQDALVQAVTSKREAVVSQKKEMIEYEASIERITTQQEIEALENVLGTMKVGAAMRRQIREQIHTLRNQLSSEGEKFDLNVGSFTLPTAYDIRRAVLGAGYGGAPAGTTVNQENQFHITNTSSDPNVLGQAIGNALGRTAQSAARSAGVA